MDDALEAARQIRSSTSFKPAGYPGFKAADREAAYEAALNSQVLPTEDQEKNPKAMLDFEKDTFGDLSRSKMSFIGVAVDVRYIRKPPSEWSSRVMDVRRLYQLLLSFDITKVSYLIKIWPCGIK